MFKKLFIIAASAIAGIYLTSEEGEKARKNILKKKSVFEPIIKDLIKQISIALNDIEEIKSDELKVNIEKSLKEAKKTLLDIDLEKTFEVIQDAIRVSSKKIRHAINSTEKSKK